MSVPDLQRLPSRHTHARNKEVPLLVGSAKKSPLHILFCLEMWIVGGVVSNRTTFRMGHAPPSTPLPSAPDRGCTPSCYILLCERQGDDVESDGWAQARIVLFARAQIISVLAGGQVNQPCERRANDGAERTWHTPLSPKE